MKQAKILIADDEAAITTGLSAILEDAGYRVDVVGDGQKALEMLSAERYGVVLADLKMPRLDGLGLLGELQKRNIPTECIIITGQATVDSAVQAMQQGAYDYIEKPLNAEKLNRLKALIPKALDKYNVQQTNRELSSRLEGLTHSAELTGQVGFQEGISCLSCHSIQKTDIRGNANYTMVQPSEYLWQWSKDGSVASVTRNFLIRTYPQEHNRLSKRMFKKPEYCAACHKQFIDQEVNRVGWVQLQNQYDNWAASHWNHKGDAKKTVECRECHMPLVDSHDPAAGDPVDYNRSVHDGKHRSHRFLASNSFMPALLKVDGWQKQVELTNKWLEGKIEIPEISKKWATGPLVKLRIEAPQSVAPGERFAFRVIMTSNKVGHDYPTGPLDMIQSWVEVKVTDEQGKVVFASGRRDEKNFLEPGTFLFKAEPVDQYGNLIDRHNLWEMVGVRYRRSLFPGYSDTVEYQAACSATVVRQPEKPKLEVNPQFQIVAGRKPATYKATAILHYRKMDQFLLNYVLGTKGGLTAPVSDIAEASAEIAVRGKS